MHVRSSGRQSQYRHYRRDRHLVVAVSVCFCFMLLSFLASRTIGEMQSRRIQREANSIGQNALVASEDLMSVRTGLRKLASSMSSLNANVTPEVALQVERDLDAERNEVATSWAHYVAIPFYPGERALVEQAGPDLIRVQRAAEAIVERLRRGDREGAVQLVAERAMPSIARSDADTTRNLEFNRREAQAAAMRITASSRRSGLIPELVGILFALASAYLGIRVLVRYLAWSRERSAELEEFAGRVAHDIRGPLGSISLSLAMVEKNKDVDTKTQELLRRVARTMDRVKQLIDDLLVFATAGGYIVPGESGERKASLRDVLDGVVEDAMLEAEKRGIALVYERPAQPLFVACGPGVLISIATNLLSNGIKFTSDAPVRQVSISARAVRNDVCFDVTDTGPGLAPDLRDRVFQPHVRGTSAEAGFGLGLATVKKLVEAHGGNVGVEPSPEGGCRFWVRLPKWSEARQERGSAWPRMPREAHGR
jgi:signal transduction histidine kinase